MRTHLYERGGAQYVPEKSVSSCIVCSDTRAINSDVILAMQNMYESVLKKKGDFSTFRRNLNDITVFDDR